MSLHFFLFPCRAAGDAPQRKQRFNCNVCYTNENNIIAFGKYQQAPWETKL